MSRPTPDPIHILRESSRASVTCLCFHENLIFSGNQLGMVHIWDCTRRRVAYSVRAHEGNSVLYIGVVLTGEAVTHGRDGYIHIWNIGKDSWTIQESVACTSMGFCACLPLSIHATLHIATPTDESAILLTRMASPRDQQVLLPKKNGGRAHGMCMCMCARINDNNASQLIVGYEDGNLVSWNLESRNLLSELHCFQDTIMAVDYHTGLNKGVCTSVGETVIVWTINDDRCMAILKSISITNPGISCVKFRPDGKIIALGGWDSQGRLLSGKKNNALAVLSFHSQSIQSLAFSSDNMLALGSKDGAISIWDLYK